MLLSHLTIVILQSLQSILVILRLLLLVVNQNNMDFLEYNFNYSTTPTCPALAKLQQTPFVELNDMNFGPL